MTMAHAIIELMLGLFDITVVAVGVVYLFNNRRAIWQALTWSEDDDYNPYD